MLFTIYLYAESHAVCPKSRISARETAERVVRSAAPNWTVETTEESTIATRLIADAIVRQGRGQRPAHLAC